MFSLITTALSIYSNLTLFVKWSGALPDMSKRPKSIPKRIFAFPYTAQIEPFTNLFGRHGASGVYKLFMFGRILEMAGRWIPGNETEGV